MVGVGDVGGGHNLNVGEKSAAKITHLYENAWHNGRDVVHAPSLHDMRTTSMWRAPFGSQSQ